LTTTEKALGKPGRKLPPIHPGEILLEEFLEPLGMNKNTLATALDVVPNRIGQIVAGKRAITAETALRLARFFGTTPEFWLNLQQRYELELARDEYEQQIERRVQPKSRAA
jgi:addiction module HigA family antidote